MKLDQAKGSTTEQLIPADLDLGPLPFFTVILNLETICNARNLANNSETTSPFHNAHKQELRHISGELVVLLFIKLRV